MFYTPSMKAGFRCARMLGKKQPFVRTVADLGTKFEASEVAQAAYSRHGFASNLLVYSKD